MKKGGRLWAGVCLAALLSACAPSPVETEKPVLPSAPTPDPYVNEYAQVDPSGLADGVVRVRYTGGTDARTRVQISREGGEKYNYDVNNAGDWEEYTLTEGDGSYTLKVFEQLEGNRYTPRLTCRLDLTLSDPLAPFLRSSPHVAFAPDSAAAALAAELTRGLETEGEKVEAVFAYVVENLSYDEEKAATVEAGYLPDVDRVLAEGKGICFDYAAVMAAMLRSQGIACKMVVGWAGEQYHAWVETPGEDGEWRRMDPTFFDGGDGSGEIRAYISDDGNYRVRYYY